MMSREQPDPLAAAHGEVGERERQYGRAIELGGIGKRRAERHGGRTVEPQP
jgi:hypothetical protein